MPIKYYLKVLCILILSGGAPVVFASVDTSGFKLSIYGGVADTSIDDGDYTLVGNQTEALAPDEKNSLNFVWGLGLAYRFVFSKYLHDISIGLDMFHFNSSQKGDLLDYGLFDNSTYQLEFESTRLMVDSEWTFHPIHSWLYPFVEAGIGFTANTTNYESTPDSNAAWEVGQSMSDNTIYQFAYNIGAGLKILLTPKIELSFRYLYAGLGSATTEESSASLPTIAGINTPVHSQAWLIGLSLL